MDEPSRSTSRRAIAGASIAVVAVAAAGFALGRSTAEPDAPAPLAQPIPTPAPSPDPVLRTIQSPLGRAELLGAARAAADAYASGQAAPESVAELAGREFVLRLPFACPSSPQGDEGPLTWEYDAEAEALRVRAQPQQWTASEWLRAERQSQQQVLTEALEGFWLERPWTSSEACPAPAAQASSPPAPAAGPTPAASPTPDEDLPAEAAPTPVETRPGANQTLGLAEFFAPGSSRVGRRNGQAYRAVERVAPDVLNLSQGLRLRLSGKIAPAPAGPPILCRGGVQTRPICLISVHFAEVAVENPATGQVLATWDVATGRGNPDRR